MSIKYAKCEKISVLGFFKLDFLGILGGWVFFGGGLLKVKPSFLRRLQIQIKFHPYTKRCRS